MGLIVPDDAWALVTVFMEAEGEPYVGKVAVAEVILRRTRFKYFSDGTVVSTCLWPFQFSGWNATAPNRVRSCQIDDDSPIVQECLAAWAEALTGSDLSKGALHYFNRTAVEHVPTWADPNKFTAAIGHHEFFTS